MTTRHTLAAVAFTCFASFAASPALAIPFTPVIDEFWVTKTAAGAAPVEIFRDSFNDNVKPPSGPDGATTYLMVGQPGMTAEAGGKLTMTPALGEQVLITTTLADVSTAAMRRLATNPLNPNILDQANAFEIHGLFDMSNLPMISGQSFGVRANDRAPDLGYLGNNTFYLFVGMSDITNEVSVFLRLNDFSNDTSVVLWSDSIQSVLTGADQIELILFKAAGSDLINATYSLFDYDLGNPLLQSGSILNAGALYQAEAGQTAEPFVRAQFISTDRITIPEPATVALLGLGFAGIGLARKRKLR